MAVPRLERHRRDIAVFLLAVALAAALAAAGLTTLEWASARWSLACHRLLPAPLIFPLHRSWRVGSCLPPRRPGGQIHVEID